MSTNVKAGVVGILVGIAVTATAAYFLSSRYKLTSGGPGGVITMRIDTWTGKTWIYRYTETNGQKTWYWAPMLESQ